MDKSRVIILKSTKIEGTPPESGAGHLMELLRAGFDKLRNGTDCEAVIRSLFPDGKRIGIKPNCVAGRSMSSSPVLCGALINILAENNIEKDNIVVWERSERELERAGYP
ncbi:MAG: hypothetical protein GF307_12805, partial [candidate division Zixibacteria bacterium]|nr:hypothetical protein [candidate division Zixibacteria bacterium]